MTIEEMNVKLKDVYKDINGGPRFRLVWSTDQLEKRFGKYEIFSESGDVYLRSEEKIEEVKKYQGHYIDKWILEEYLPTAGNPYLEPIAKYSYEPIWTFGAANSDPTPVWWAVEMLIQSRFDGTSRPVVREKEYKELEEEKVRKEQERIRVMLRNDTPDLPFALKHGMGIVVPESYEKKEKVD